MKKILIICLSILFLSFSLERSIYDIQIMLLNGDNISMDRFKGQKLIITAFSTSNPDAGYLKYLNILQQSDSKLKIIAVPALDFGGDIPVNRLSAFRDSLNLNLIFTRPSYVTKASKERQHKLFRWLTWVDENAHFDIDVERYDQLFFVSPRGTLYGVLPKGSPQEAIDKVLGEGISE